ncbi:MAG: PfkB family carbohydrate kinase [Eubacteriales bacterium]|nr:PfkB family carbohydrate kinase [Eubacteriales bacterium]
MDAPCTPTVIVAGHICLDITPDLSAQEPGTLQTLLRPGRLVGVGAADVHPGGCVANTGLALQRLGVRSRLIARVGHDALGRLVEELVRASGAECALHVDPQAATSYSVVVAPPGVDRVFLHHAGANGRFCAEDVPDTLLLGAKLLHFGYPPLMPELYRNNGEALRSLFARARTLGLSTSLDMTAIDPQSEAAQVDWTAFLTSVLPQVDFFLPSAEELCFMLDRPRHEAWIRQAEGSDIASALAIPKDVAPLMDRLMAMGARVVVIKCGARGMYYHTADQAALRDIRFPLDIAAWANRGGIQPAFRPRKLLSASGAGDVSIAAFLASVLTGCPPETCVRRAAAAGACCVEAFDVLGGLVPFPALDRRIAEGWETC